MIHTRHNRWWFWMEESEAKVKNPSPPKRRARGKHAGLMLEFALMLALTLLLPRGRK